MEGAQASSFGGGEGGWGDSGGGGGRDRWFDPTPLLRHHRLLRQPPTGASRGGGGGGRSVPFLIGRASTRRLMRSPSMALREAAALRLEERQIDWGYSRPLVALDLIWSLAFVLVSCSVLLATVRERPSTPIRIWILGYALHCLVHVSFVCFEYRRRQRTRRGSDRWAEVEAGDEGEEEEGSVDSRQSRVMKKLESTNAVISFFWWMLGLYWIVVGGQTLLQDAPRLYWLTVVFLAFDVFFAIFCILLACIIGVALCCCLPCIIAILYAVTGQGGASDAHLDSLPRFRFRIANQPEAMGTADHQVPADITDSRDTMNDLSLSPEDSDCCICLCRYEDGAELCSLPCNHHFHSGCIIKWLRINATCPLCKHSILRNDEQA